MSRALSLLVWIGMALFWGGAAAAGYLAVLAWENNGSTVIVQAIPDVSTFEACAEEVSSDAFCDREGL